jgi:hypothetical protein
MPNQEEERIIMTNSNHATIIPMEFLYEVKSPTL